jgi:hypothetical protein
MHKNFRLGNLKERDISEDLSIDGKIIIIECMLENRMGRCGTDSCGCC